LFRQPSQNRLAPRLMVCTKIPRLGPRCHIPEFGYPKRSHAFLH
jgi:hypothetical protein